MQQHTSCTGAWVVAARQGARRARVCRLWLTKGGVRGKAADHVPSHQPAHAVCHEHHAERLLMLLMQACWPTLRSRLGACSGHGSSMMAAQVLDAAQNEVRLFGLQPGRAYHVCQLSMHCKRNRVRLHLRAGPAVPTWHMPLTSRELSSAEASALKSAAYHCSQIGQPAGSAAARRASSLPVSAAADRICWWLPR